MSDRLDGWTEIADYVNKSENTCRRLASASYPEGERLPVFFMGRMVTALRADLDAWVKRLRELGRNHFASAPLSAA